MIEQIKIVLNDAQGNKLNEEELFPGSPFGENDKIELLNKMLEVLAMVFLKLEQADCILEFNCRSFVSQGILFDLNKKIRKNKEPGLFSLLSRREKEVLKLILEGYKTKEIAQKLFVSFETIKTHRKNILGKTNSKNIASLSSHYSPLLKQFDFLEYGPD